MKDSDYSYIFAIPVILFTGIALGMTYSKISFQNQRIAKLQSNKKQIKDTLKAQTEKLEIIAGESQTLQNKIDQLSNDLKIEEANFKKKILSLNINHKLDFREAIHSIQKIQEENSRKLTLDFEDKINQLFIHFLNLGLEQISTQAKIVEVDDDIFMAMKYNYLLNAMEWAKELSLQKSSKFILKCIQETKPDINDDILTIIQELSNQTVQSLNDQSIEYFNCQETTVSEVSLNSIGDITIEEI